MALIELKQGDTVILGNKKVPTIQNPIFRNRKFVLLPIDYKNKLKDKILVINNKKILIHIRQGKYNKEQIKVAKSKVEPGKKSFK